MRQRREHRPDPIELALERDMDGQQEKAKLESFGPRVRERTGRIGVSELDARAFATRLGEALRERGVSLDEFAHRLGFSRRQVATWTTSQNPRVPDPAILIAICREFALSANHLLLGIPPAGLNATVERPSLSDEVRTTLREALYARDHELPAIDAVLTADGDVIARWVDIYSLRIRLLHVSTFFGMTAAELDFAVKEIEVRYRRAIRILEARAARTSSARLRPVASALARARARTRRARRR